MADSNPPEQFKDITEIAKYAETMLDIDEMIKFVEAENLKLNPPWDKEDINQLLNKISTHIRETQPDRLYKQCLEEMKNLVPGDDKDNKLEQVKNFVKCSNLLKLNEDEALEIIINTCEKFDLKTKWESVITKFYKRLKSEATNKNSKSNAKQKDDQGTTEESNEEYPQWARDKANEILDNGDSFLYIRKTWNTRHIGDKNIGEHLLCSIGGTMIPNTRLGLHMKPSGATGTGKSDAIDCMLDLLPKYKYITGSLSSKVLFYEDLKKGTIVSSDDAKLEGDIIVTLRAITSNYQKEAIHRTLDSELKVNVRRIPPRTTLWASSVHSIQDEQLERRFGKGDTDESSDQDEKVNNHQKSRATHVFSADPDDDTLICRCIFDMIFQNECVVYAPLVDAVVWNDTSHRRNFDKFQDMLFSITLYNYRNRVKVHGGIVSTLADYDRALEVYSGTAAKNACNLNGKEMGIMTVIQQSPGRIITFTEIQEKTGIKETSLRYMMDGRNGGEGLLGKVTGLYKLDKSETVSWDNGNTRSTTKGTVYRYTGDIFELGSKLFESVAIIDRDKADRLTREFIESDYEKGTNSHNSHTTLTSNVRDKNDNSIVYNNNNNTIITDIGERGGGICEYNGDIEKIYLKNIGIGLPGEICESSRESCQQTTNASLTTLTTVSTDAVNNCERYVGDNCEDSSESCQTMTIANSGVNVRALTPNIDDGVSVLVGDTKALTPNIDDGVSVLVGDTKVNLIPLLRRALIKFAKTEYHSTVLDLDKFTRDFNQRTPEFKKTLGSFAVENEARKLKMTGGNNISLRKQPSGQSNNTISLQNPLPVRDEEIPEIKTVNSRVVSEEEGYKILKAEGY